MVLKSIPAHEAPETTVNCDLSQMGRYVSKFIVEPKATGINHFNSFVMRREETRSKHTKDIESTLCAKNTTVLGDSSCSKYNQEILISLQENP